jgi:hypothetical protein
MMEDDEMEKEREQTARDRERQRNEMLLIHEWWALVRIDGADSDERWCWNLTDPDFSASQWEVVS